MDTSSVLYVREGHKKDLFKDFRTLLLKRGGLPENNELFSINMSVSYKAGRAEYFKESDEVHDRFHIIKFLNEGVDKVRKAGVKHCAELRIQNTSG